MNYDGSRNIVSDNFCTFTFIGNCVNSKYKCVSSRGNCSFYSLFPVLIYSGSHENVLSSALKLTRGLPYFWDS